ncbi:MAG: hypothetical protein ACHQYP_02815 [Nitrospiria bacterium]
MIGVIHLIGAKNARLATRLEMAIRQVNALKPPPDFVVYTQDAERDDTTEQIFRFSSIASCLISKSNFIPGDLDWHFDLGESFRAHAMTELFLSSFILKVMI